MTANVQLITGDVRAVLQTLPAGSVQCVVTSPPYWGLRNYGVSGQIGLELLHDCLGWATGQPCGACYVCHMVSVFREVRRVLRDDGVLFLNLGDSYANDGKWGGSTGGKHVNELHGTNGPGRTKRQTGLKPKDLVGIPWRVALALQADGWWLRSEIVWSKAAPMPESVTDRPTRAHEQIFLLTKRERYFYDQEAVREPHSREWWLENVGKEYMTPQDGRRDGGKRKSNGTPSGANQRDVWHLSPEPYPDAHFATFVSEIPRRAILAGTSAAGCCPACGAPYVRVVERTNASNWQGRKASGATAGQPTNGHNASHGNGIDHTLPTRINETTGWRPSCACDAGEPVPCHVLDPFSGSGTTAAVALALGRDAIGIELNPEYTRLAEDRIAWVTPALFGL